MRATIVLWLLVACVAVRAPAEEALPRTEPAICERDLRSRVGWLASDDLKGRDSISPEAQRASAWIAAQWERQGLLPKGTEGSWFQPLTIAEPVLEEGNALRTEVGGDARDHAVETEWNPFSVSPRAEAEGEVVFAGYGIHAPERGYDDYAGLDPKGRVVLVLRKSPGWQEVKHAAFLSKVHAAAERGASAVLLCNNPDTTQGGEDRIGHWSASLGPPTGSAPIPYAFVTQAIAERLLAPTGETLSSLEARLRAKGPHSFPIAGARVRLATALGATREQNARNVIGFLPGRDPDLAEEVVVLGAHYDHIGLGLFGSTGGASAAGQIHNGADDNASGTASLLELAEWFAQPENRPRRSLLFIAFTGEERGLLGSLHYVEHPTVPLADCVAMVNLDMVGRCRGESLEVGGVGTARGLQDLVAGRNAKHRLNLTWDPDGVAPSDSTSFFRKGLPVLFFFTRLHEDYHRPTDDAECLEYPNMVRICNLIADVVTAIGDADERLVFTKPPPRPRPPVLGIVPSPEPDPRGVVVGSVAEGGPAAQAGMEEGDAIVAIAGQVVRDLDTLRAALSKLEAGKTVPVEVLRGDERVTLKVTLGGRPGR
jgi:hypothetical protein